MNIESTNDNTPTTPAITYSECYRLPFLSLFHADCMDIMKQYPDKYFDLAIVDPPYGININVSMGRRKGDKKSDYHKFAGEDKSIPSKEYYLELFRISKNQIIWGGNYMTEYLKPSPCWILWDKGFSEDVTFAQFEMAWTSFSSSAKKYDFNAAANKDRIHPTEKPKELYAWLLSRYAQNGFLILDTHFGSGSIALAVDKANRLDKMNLHLTACEIDKEYIDKAIKRISESIKQGTLSFQVADNGLGIADGGDLQHYCSTQAQNFNSSAIAQWCNVSPTIGNTLLAAGVLKIIKMKANKIVYSRLISKGNYENAKIEIELEVEAGEKASEVFEAAKKWVEKRIAVEKLSDYTIEKARKVMDDKRNHTLAQIEEAEEILAKVKVSDDELPFQVARHTLAANNWLNEVLLRLSAVFEE